MTRAAVLLLFAASLLTFSADADARRADPAVPAKDGKKTGFEGRTKEGKARLLKEFGGSPEGEEAVMLGLAWLAQVQKQDGNWEYETAHHRADRAAATGMAVLAFTGAGQSHKEGRYKQTMQAAVNWLANDVDMSQGPDRGKFRSVTHNYMYQQGIASLALIEAYGMTRDPALKPVAQAVVDYIQKAQGARGSWGYRAREDNDTSILGWQIQALHAAQLAQDLEVDPKVIAKAMKFLDFVSPGQTKSAYGYSHAGEAQPATSRTAIGLLCRYYVDNWRPDTPGFAEGSKGLMRRAATPATSGGRVDLYYAYYATQVVRFYGGEEWKTWNEGPKQADGTRKGGLADVLLNLQVRTPTDRGSWNPHADYNGLSFGPQCGRLGMTCMCLLTLEVYYRYTPEAEKKDKDMKP